MSVKLRDYEFALYDSRDKKHRAAGKPRGKPREEGNNGRILSTRRIVYAGHACASNHTRARRTREYIIRAQNQWCSRG